MNTKMLEYESVKCRVQRVEDAADAIVALGLDNEDYEHENRRLHGEIEALQAEQKKTVTQIFGEEQMAWEGRCKDLMKLISDLQAEIRESMQKCAECGDAQEQKVNGLQAEVERLKDSNEELREKQTYIDHYGDKWMTSAKDVPTAAYEHGYMDGMDEAKAQLQKHGEWVRKESENIYWFECSECGGHPMRDTWDGEGKLTDFCPRCGADMRKMEVQDG